MAEIGDAVLVEWRDATHSSGWMTPDELPTEPIRVVTVGILLADTERAMTVGLSVTPHDEGANCTMVVPAVGITKVAVLRRHVV